MVSSLLEAHISKKGMESFEDVRFRATICVSYLTCQQRHLLPEVPLPALHIPSQKLPCCTYLHGKNCFVKLNFYIEMLQVWCFPPPLKFLIIFSGYLPVKMGFPHHFYVSELFCHVFHQSDKLKDFIALHKNKKIQISFKRKLFLGISQKHPGFPPPEFHKKY